MSSRTKAAVLLTCHGTVESVDDIPDFVRNIRRGHPAPASVVEEVTRRFEAIGGSPLMRITKEQAKALEARLRVPVRAAARLWTPYPEEVVRPLVESGVRHIVSLPLAPQSVHVYNEFVLGRLSPLGVSVSCAGPYGLEPALVRAFVDAIDEARRAVSADAPTAIVLSAHSLPLRVIAGGDPYQADFEAMAHAVEHDLVDAGYDPSAIRVAYQSQGMGGGEWLGPDLAEVFRELRAAGHEALVVAPIGFLAEHVETLYDIDVEAAALARSLGFADLVRMPAMNTRKGLIDALEAVAVPLLRAV